MMTILVLDVVVVRIGLGWLTDLFFIVVALISIVF
jgi:hypothetical protein